MAEKSRRISREPSESGERRRTSRMGSLVPEIVLVSDERQITLRQLEILKAVSAERSQNRAAKRLGISAAVLNKQLRELEKRAKTRLVNTGVRGSQLTPEGRQLLRVLEILSNRMNRPEQLMIGCTQVTQSLVERLSGKLAERGIVTSVIVGDDETNMNMGSGGLLDIVFLDDPIFAYEYPKEGKVHEVTKDLLLHVDRGKQYIRLSSGPQRIGFDSLRADGIDHDIMKTVYDPAEAVRSRFSFFVSKMLLTNRRLKTPQNAEIRNIPYTIYAIETTDHADIAKFFDHMAPMQYYPIG